MKKNLPLSHHQIITSSHHLILFLFFAFFSLNVSAQDCTPPNKTAEISVNNIRALLKTNGAHFCYNSTAQFEVPKGSGKTSLFSGALWLAAMDEQDKLHVAAMRFGQSGNDYFAGPISNDVSASSFYDKFWHITKKEIDEHRAHHSDPNYNIPVNILSWPAHGRIQYGESSYLAPYKSISGQAKYSPQLGDYPEIRGDEAILFIQNDNCRHTESEGRSLGVEILGMVYAYDADEVELSNTIFLSYTIKNKSANNYQDLYIGFFSDFDIGYSEDDYVGCDSTLNLGYGYNGKPVDGSGESHAYGANPPAQGAMFLNQKMSAFMYFTKTSMWWGPYIFPSIVCYGYLRAYWGDGVPLTYGGNGYNPASTETTKYAFSGDPETGTGWTEVNAGNTPYDRRGVLSAGPFTLPANESICIDIALPWARSTQGYLNSVTLLKESAQAIQQFYNQQNYVNYCNNPVGIKEIENNFDIQVYPNPTRGELRVTSYELQVNKGINPLVVEVFDIYGRKQKAESRRQKAENEMVLDISGLSAGVYFVRISTEKGVVNKKVVKY